MPTIKDRFTGACERRCNDYNKEKKKYSESFCGYLEKMMRNIFFLAVIVGFTISMVSLSFAGPDVEDSAPAFTLQDTALVYHSLSDFTGKVIVLNFWAST